MLNRNKIFTIGFGLSALAAALFSFTNGEDDDKKKKYHVIHQQDGELVEFDTILPMSSSYTVENFLADKGIDSEDVEIIKVPSMGKDHFMFDGEGMEGEHRVMIQEFTHDLEVDGDGEAMEVKIMCEMGDDGKMVTKKFVNGEEVEMSEEDMENIEKHKQMKGEHMMIKMDGDHPHGHDMVIIQEGEEGDTVQITVEIDDKGNKVVKKVVNGEEVEMTEEELEKMHMHNRMEGERVIIKMDMDDEHRHDMEITTEGEEGDRIEIMVEIDDKGNKIIKKTVNGEEVEMTEDELEKMHHGHKMHHGNKTMMHHIDIDDSDMTDEEKEKMMEELQEKLSHMTITLDSMGENMEFQFETLLEEFHELDGEHSVIIERIQMDGDDMNGESEDGHHEMRMFHSDDEDFTIVIVTEDLSDEDVENVEVKREMASNGMKIYPNPNDGVFTIQFDQSEKMKTKVEILDAQGKVVFTDKLGKFTGQYKKEVDLKEFVPGMYIINVQQGDRILSNKVIVD